MDCIYGVEQMDAAKLLIPVKRYVNLAGKFYWPVSQWPADSATSVPAPGPVAVRIRCNSRLESREAYQMTILPDKIEITAAGDAGAYYAIQTLMNLIALEKGNLHCCKIEDWPDFARRGVYLDCSRGKVPKLDTLKELVSRLAHWKINELQLYIENVFTFSRHPAIGRGYSPFTSDDILALQDYCKLHHVRLVGSLASLGHTEKILMLPEYQHLGELPGFSGFAGGTTLCPTDPGSIKLVGELYEEFVPLFQAVDFNVCGDEPWELGKGRSKRSAHRLGVGRVYLNYFMKLYHLCQKHNKRMNVWADIILEHPELLKEIPKDVVMLNWDYNIGGERVSRTKEIAKAKLPFMVCPGTSSWNTHGTRLANAMGNVAEFAAQGLKYRAEGLLNTDWGDNGHRNFLGVSLHGFAHGAAHSWNSKDVDDKTFTQRFCKSVFGDTDGKLAKALNLLGSTYLTCGAPYQNESALFYTLIEPMKNNKAITPSRIDATSETGLKNVISQLSDESIWPGTKGLGEFERLTLRELKTAARMDCLAAQRALAAKKIRNGGNVPAGQLRKIKYQMHKIAKDFRTLWLARNKPSRLQDNLKLFRRIENESLKLSRK
ncbi:MAG: beta-N-acetylhexosaminidase [Planctomycetota bacterium]|nr:beta-N-acetylhexosaminidase [Planctomycetota bacterium]